MNSPTVERYKRFRSAGKKLNQKIIDTLLTEKVLEIAADALGVREKKRLVLEDDDEMGVLMDFALYEVLKDGKNLITRYADEVGGSSKVERDLLTAMRAARVGLFRVSATQPTFCQLELKDAIQPDRILNLTDISLSESIEHDIVFFFRPLELAEFTMTSGMGFPFPLRMEKELIDIWKKWAAAERYVKYFELNRRSGISMSHWQV